MTTVQTIAAIAFALIAFMFVNEMDYRDAVREEQHYCHMVKEGHWPHYNKDIDCNLQNIRGTKW